jgi:glycosyltransferase involved in cell wall biosynthesis
MIKLAPSQRSKPAIQNNFKVIAGIPCFNTSESIAKVVSATRKYVDEVVVIDDGSTDDTAQKAQAAGATVVSHGINRGYGASIISCFQAAFNKNASFLVTIDGDGQHNPEDIPSLLAPLWRGEADLVIGSRSLNPVQKTPLYRRFGIGLINWLWNIGSKVKVTDTQSGCRAYSRHIFQNLPLYETGMSISIEILEKLRRTGTRIQEVPISCSYEDNNTSPSLKAFLHGYKVAFSVLRLRLLRKIYN